MFNQPISDENFTLFAAHKYQNPACESEEEFYEDLNRVKYIKRLFRKYKDSGVLKERLLLNHIIVLNNLFGAEAASTLLFFKIEIEHWSALKSFLRFLNIMPEQDLNHIKEDPFILQRLSEI